jgi:hypothetical protein
MKGWHYWDEYGDILWETVQELVHSLHVQLEARHQEILARQWEKHVRDALLAVGLDKVKCVTLRLPQDPGNISNNSAVDNAMIEESQPEELMLTLTVAG